MVTDTEPNDSRASLLKETRGTGAQSPVTARVRTITLLGLQVRGGGGIIAQPQPQLRNYVTYGWTPWTAFHTYLEGERE